MSEDYNTEDREPTVVTPETQPVPVDEPRTLWFNEYENGRLGSGYKSLAECIDAGKPMNPLKQVKFVEVKE